MSYDNNLSGMLSRNERKNSETSADFKGQCEINGTQFWIDAWVNVAKEGSKLAGKKYFRLKFKAKEAPPQQDAPPATTPAVDKMDENVPF